jgi:hypothetical protein
MLPEMDMITLTNAVALLEEAVANGEDNPSTIEAWFVGEQDSIRRTILDLNELIENMKIWNDEDVISSLPDQDEFLARFDKIVNVGSKDIN